MSGQTRAILRLFAVQGAWSYERMLGIGMGYAAMPLLEELARTDPERYREAVGRASEFFNCNPYLAGVALGALARAERDHAPGPQVLRLRQALCSPLGALGDQLFWAGLVPALSGLTLALVASGGRWWPVLGFVLVFNAVRIVTARWGLRAGLQHGMSVGRALQNGWLPRAIARIGPLAGFSVGLAVPLAARWFFPDASRAMAALALGVAMAGLGLSLRLGRAITPIRFTLAALVAALLWRWGTA
ncbi:MAG: PTS system mannose/fructose/sorbose family transporter subunit IID [Gemmatimonadota bacterium]